MCNGADRKQPALNSAFQEVRLANTCATKVLLSPSNQWYRLPVSWRWRFHLSDTEPSHGGKPGWMKLAPEQARMRRERCRYFPRFHYHCGKNTPTYFRKRAPSHKSNRNCVTNNHGAGARLSDYVVQRQTCHSQSKQGQQWVSSGNLLLAATWPPTAQRTATGNVHTSKCTNGVHVASHDFH